MGFNLCPLQWKLRVLTTGRPGNSIGASLNVTTLAETVTNLWSLITPYKSPRIPGTPTLVTHAILETRIHPPPNQGTSPGTLLSEPAVPAPGLPLSTMNFPRKGTSLGPGTPLVSSRPTAGTFCPNSVPAWFGLSLHQMLQALCTPEPSPLFTQDHYRFPPWTL